MQKLSFSKFNYEVVMRVFPWVWAKGLIDITFRFCFSFSKVVIITLRPLTTEIIRCNPHGLPSLP